MPIERNTFRPPAPMPRADWPGLFDLARTLWNNPIEAWTQAHFEQPIVRTHLPFANIVAVNDPAAVRRVLSDNAENYCKDRFQKRMLTVLSNGLLTAENEQWRSQRRLIAPLFTMRAVKSMASTMSDTIAEFIASWASRDGIIDIAEETTDLALAVLERTIFSGGIANGRDDLRAAMRTYFDALGRIDPFDLVSLPDFVPRLSRLYARPAVRIFHQTIDDMIAARQRDLKKNGALDIPHDILMLLIKARDAESGRRLTQEEIRANVITFLAAGHESTANAITWALYLLSRSPEWRQRVRAEAEREINVSCSPPFNCLIQTRAVIEESLRLYPPLAAISRMARANDKLAGVRVPAGAMVVISPYVLHRHRFWGKRADQFDPARFLPGSRENIDRYAYLPFGAGARGCIASVFALQEATLAVAAITQKFELEMAPDHEVWPVHRITLRPKGGLPMLVRRCSNIRPKWSTQATRESADALALH